MRLFEHADAFGHCGRGSTRLSPGHRSGARLPRIAYQRPGILHFFVAERILAPQNAVHYFDIVHCDNGERFPNHAAMAFGRGRFFVSTYLNPKFMSEEDWRVYAGLLKWARANREILRRTVVLPSDVELGEPYVYAHWQGTRGILAVRNPSNESQESPSIWPKRVRPRTLRGPSVIPSIPAARESQWT